MVVVAKRVEGGGSIVHLQEDELERLIDALDSHHELLKAAKIELKHSAVIDLRAQLAWVLDDMPEEPYPAD